MPISSHTIELDQSPENSIDALMLFWVIIYMSQGNRMIGNEPRDSISVDKAEVNKFNAAAKVSNGIFVVHLRRAFSGSHAPTPSFSSQGSERNL